MLKITCEIWNKQDKKHRVGFPASYNNSYDLTNYVIENGIKLTKRIEYDSFESIAFAECEITLINNSIIDEILELITNRIWDRLGIIKIDFAYKNYFVGIIDTSNISKDFYNDTITLRVEDILKNLIDYFDVNYLPYRGNATMGNDINNNIFMIIVSSYVYQSQIDKRLINPNAVNVFNFRESRYYNEIYTNYRATYNRLAEYSQGHFLYDDIHYDRFSVLDLLKESAKYQTWCIFLENRILNFRSKVKPYGQALNLDDLLIEGIKREYDYKPKYDGIVMNFYNSNGADEGWYVFYKDSERTRINDGSGKYIEVVRIFRIKDMKQINQTILDMRYNLYSNFKDLTAERWTRGYTENSVVFYTYNAKKINNKFYWELDLDTYNYFNNLLLGKTELVKTEVIGLNYQVGKDYKIDGKNYILVEAEYNFEEEKTNLTLRNLE